MSEGDTCVITGSTEVSSIGVSDRGNGRQSVPHNSHSMVGVRIPVEVHVILTESPSITRITNGVMGTVIDVLAAWKGL